MTYYDANGKMLLSAALAKARHALGITQRMPAGRVRYSKAYWVKVIEIVAANNQSKCKFSIEEAIDKYEDYDKG